MSHRVETYPILPSDLEPLVVELVRVFGQYGQAINDMHMDGKVTWDPPNLAAGAGATSANISVPDAAVGDYVMVGAPYDLQGITATGYVSASGTVVIRLYNSTGGAIDLASGEWEVRVMRKHVDAIA